MHEQNCRHGNELENEVAIANRVDTVFRNSWKAQQLGDIVAIDGEAGSRQGAGAEREHVDALETARKPLPVALEHFIVSKQVMRKSHRLSALEVCIAGHDDVQILLGDARQLPLERLQTLDDAGNLFAQEKTCIEGDLIVATARRVELSSGGADLLA